MVRIRIGTNEGGQRLDRFLRKYLRKAPLPFIYKIIRKDAKVNGRREKNDYMLQDGDELTLYLPEEEAAALSEREQKAAPKRSFSVAYEDGDILVADKPAGLLTHGDSAEKQDHLANQVLGYLMDKGEFDPRQEKTFRPAPVNRLDRNTTGLVIFAKNYPAQRALAEMLRERTHIRKYYYALVKGAFGESRRLAGAIVKDERTNTSGLVSIKTAADEQDAKAVEIRVAPVKTGTLPGAGAFTLVEVELLTGRTHQIRVQLAAEGYPIAGDRKYGDPEVNRTLAKAYGVSAQLLTAAKLAFEDMPDPYGKYDGTVIEAKLPKTFRRVLDDLA